MKGLSLGIYEDKSMSNCSNGGISSYCKKVTLICPEAPIFEATDEEPAVVLKTREYCGQKYVYAEPAEDVPNGRHGWMAGGCYISTCDSRMEKYCGQRIIALHDRCE